MLNVLVIYHAECTSYLVVYHAECNTMLNVVSVINCYDSLSQIVKIICGTLYLLYHTKCNHGSYNVMVPGVGVGLIHEL